MDKKIDLGFGNPAFLFKYWQKQDLPDTSYYYPTAYMEQKQNAMLEAAILSIHQVIGNVDRPQDYEIVIGNGASQLLSAIMYETYGTRVSAPPPYFTRFPVLAQIANNLWSEYKWKEVDESKLILTTPNNPTGDWVGYDEFEVKPRLEILDACYNWPQYCSPRKLEGDIIVFSLSKATGHAGARLGWALFKDKDLAARVKQSIELSTMGVSSMAQDVGKFVLQREAKRFSNEDTNVFTTGKAELDRRWEIIRGLELPFKILNNSSMFLWCEGEIPEHVEGLLGSHFGDSNKKFRLNIGCSKDDFEAFLQPYLPPLTIKEVEEYESDEHPYD